MNVCERCHQRFHHAPKYHRCPGEWEAMCADAGAVPVVDPFAGMSWAEECLAKVMAPGKEKA